MWWVRSVVTGVLFWVCVLPAGAEAHATPITYVPALGTTELTVPASISIRFTERIEVGASSLTVFDPSGNAVNEGKGTIDPSDERVLVVPIRDGGEGVYTISWQVVSVDDGHFTKGAYSFLVDGSGAAFTGDAGGSTEITYTTSLTDASYSFLGLLGESLFLGVLILLSFLAKPLMRVGMESVAPWVAAVRKIVLSGSVVGFVLLLLGTGGAILKKTHELATLQSEAFLDSLVVYLGSSAGMYGVVKMVLGGLFVAVLFAGRKRMFESGRITLYEWMLFVLVWGIIIIQSIVSHAAASLFYPELSVAVTAVHLFAKELMVGGVFVLLLCLARFFDDGWMSIFDRIAARFDRIAAVLLLFAGLSGVYITWLHLKHFDNLYLTEWGDRFIILLILTGAFGCFRIFHHFVVHPLLLRRSFMPLLYRLTLPVEVSLALLTLFYSGYISLTTPPFIVEQYRYVQTIESEGVAIRLETPPYEDDVFRIMLSDTETGASIDPQKLILTATERERGIGPNVLPVAARFPGGFVFPQNDLTPPGTWELGVIVEREGSYNAHGTFVITYPSDIAATRYSDEVRRYDDFAQAMLLIAGLMFVVSLALMIHAHYRVRALEAAPMVPNPVPVRTPLPLSAISLLLSLVVVGITVSVYYAFFQSDFRRQCIGDGFVWKQAFPARDMESVSGNALSGCWIHDGHYHIIDEREYESAKEDLR